MKFTSSKQICLLKKKKPVDKGPSKEVEFYNKQVEKGEIASIGKAMNEEERARAIEKQRKKAQKSRMDDLFGNAPKQGQTTLFQSDMFIGEELNEAEKRIIKNKDYDRRALKALIHKKIIELQGINKDKKEAKAKTLNYIKQLVIEYAKRNLPKNFMKRHQAAILMRGVKNAKTYKSLDNAFKDIDAIALSINRAVIKSKIMKLAKIRPGKYKGKPRGTSLTADEYRKLNNIKKYVFMSPEEAYKATMNYMTREANGETLEEFEKEDLYRIQVFGGIKDTRKNPEMNKPLATLQQALEELESIVNEGRTKRQESEKQERAQRKAQVKDVKKVITGGKPISDWQRVRKDNRDKIEGALARFDTIQQSFEWILDKLSKFDDSAPLQSALMYFRNIAYKAGTANNKGVRKRTEQLQNKLLEIYGIKVPDNKLGAVRAYGKLTKLLKKNTERRPVNAKHINEFGNFENLPDMTQNEIYKKYMEWRDPSLHMDGTFERMGWTQDTMNDLLEELDPKLKEWADWQLEVFYRDYHKPVNDVYKKLYYVDLPFNPFYSPITREHGKNKGLKDDELLRDKKKSGFGSVQNSSFISRVSNNRPLMPVDGDATLMKHIIEMEHFKAWAEAIREMRSVLGSEEVQSAIAEYHGRFIRKVLNKFIDDMARGGVDRALLFDGVDKLRAKFVVSVIGANLTVTPKQLMSIPAYSMDIPKTEWLKHTGDFLGNPAKWVKRTKILLSSEDMKARYGVGWERDIILAMQRSVPKKLSGKTNLRDVLMLNTKLGDAGAIIIGGWAVYKYNYDKLIENGVSPERAKKIALERFYNATRRTQQAGEPVDLPHAMRLGSFMRLMTMFMTSPNSYFRVTSGAVRNLRYGRGNKTDNLYNIAIAHFILPAMFQFAASGFPGLFSDWDDKDGKRLLRSLIVGSFNGLFIAGDIIESLANMIFIDKRVFGSMSEISVLKPVDIIGQGLVRFLNLDEYTLEEIIKFADKLVQGASNFLGVPYQPLKKLVKGVEDVFSDPTAEKIKLLGYSDYALGERILSKKQKTLKSAVNNKVGMEKYLSEMQEYYEKQGIEFNKTKKRALEKEYTIRDKYGFDNDIINILLSGKKLKEKAAALNKFSSEKGFIELYTEGYKELNFISKNLNKLYREKYDPEINNKVDRYRLRELRIKRASGKLTTKEKYILQGLEDRPK